MKLKFAVLFILSFLIYSCATLPKPLQNIPALRDVPFSLVKENPDKYKDILLLWGGRIINCVNTQEGTTFEILHLPLDREGYPEETDASEGRFIVTSKSFLDCAVYTNGRFLTVAGRFKGLKEGKINEMPYSFPLIEAQATYLWKKQRLYYRDYYYWHPSIWFWYGSPHWWFEYGPYWLPLRHDRDHDKTERQPPPHHDHKKPIERDKMKETSPSDDKMPICSDKIKESHK